MPLGGCSSSYCHQLFWCCRCLSFYEPLHRSLGSGSERGSLSRRTKWTEKKRGNWLLFSGVACHYCAPGCFGWFKDTFFQHFFFYCLSLGWRFDGVSLSRSGHVSLSPARSFSHAGWDFHLRQPSVSVPLHLTTTLYSLPKLVLFFYSFSRLSFNCLVAFRNERLVTWQWI